MRVCACSFNGIFHTTNYVGRDAYGTWLTYSIEADLMENEELEMLLGNEIVSFFACICMVVDVQACKFYNKSYF